MEEWLIANRLSFNIGKSYFKIHAHNYYDIKNFIIRIRDRLIKHVTSIKFLGWSFQLLHKKISIEVFWCNQISLWSKINWQKPFFLDFWQLIFFENDFWLNHNIAMAMFITAMIFISIRKLRFPNKASIATFSVMCNKHVSLLHKQLSRTKGVLYRLSS